MREDKNYNRWEKVWDSVWQSRARGVVISWFRTRYGNMFFKLLKSSIDNNSRVLELGFGTGKTLLALAPLVHKTVGIDISKQAFVITRQLMEQGNISNTQLIKGNCKDVPYKGEFDLVYSAGLIEHFFDQDIEVVKQHIKAIKPKGVVIICVPYKWSLHYLHYVLTRPRAMRWLWPWSNEANFQKFYTKRSLQQLGRQTGLRYRVYFLPPLLIGIILGLIVVEFRSTGFFSK